MSPDWQQIFVFILMVSVFIAFFREVMSIELIALTAAGLLLISGILSAGELLSCFSNSAPVTIASLFIVTAALERTGQISRLGRIFNDLAGGSEKRALATLLIGCTVISAFVNNTPLVVVLMPVILGFCRESGAKPSKLLIPLSFATILGGTCSMAGTSTNILVDGIVKNSGMEGFSLFAILPLGMVYALIGGVYLWFVAPKLLPSRDTLATSIPQGAGRAYLVQAAVPIDSSLVGKRLSEMLKTTSRKLHIIEVRRRGTVLESAMNEIILEGGDRILIKASTREISELNDQKGINLGPDEGSLEPMEQRDAILLEGMIGPNSAFQGKTLKQIAFRQKFGALILAVHREGKNITRDFEKLTLEFGDTLLVQGSREGVDRLKEERDFITLTEPSSQAYNTDKGGFAIGGIALFVFLASFNFAWVGLPGVGFDTFSAAFISALFVLLAGCLRPSEAYQAVDWRIIFLIVGMLAVGGAMEKTGAAQTLATGLAGVLGPFGPVGILCGVYLLSTVLTEMISNNAVAVVLAPIVISLAHTLELSPLPFVVAVMFGASASFATPIGYQTNTYVFGAGGYHFKDFVKVGLPLNIILWITATFLIPILWPFEP